jgi:hypothetical protein
MDNEIKHLDQFAIESMVREACMSCGGVYLITWPVISCVGGPRLWADLGEHLGQVRPGFCRNQTLPSEPYKMQSKHSSSSTILDMTTFLNDGSISGLRMSSHASERTVSVYQCLIGSHFSRSIIIAPRFKRSGDTRSTNLMNRRLYSI